MQTNVNTQKVALINNKIHTQKKPML